MTATAASGGSSSSSSGNTPSSICVTMKEIESLAPELTTSDVQAKAKVNWKKYVAVGDGSSFKAFLLHKEASFVRGLLEGLIEDDEENDDESILPVYLTSDIALRVVVAYCNKMVEEKHFPKKISRKLKSPLPQNTKFNDLKDITEWEKSFVRDFLVRGGEKDEEEKDGQQSLFDIHEIFLVCNYFDCSRLMDCCFAYFAISLTLLTRFEFENEFLVEGDVTAGELAAITERNESGSEKQSRLYREVFRRMIRLAAYSNSRGVCLLAQKSSPGTSSPLFSIVNLLQFVSGNIKNFVPETQHNEISPRFSPRFIKEKMTWWTDFAHDNFPEVKQKCWSLPRNIRSHFRMPLLLVKVKSKTRIGQLFREEHLPFRLSLKFVDCKI